jgi:hypothetical protein
MDGAIAVLITSGSRHGDRRAVPSGGLTGDQWFDEQRVGTATNPREISELVVATISIIGLSCSLQASHLANSPDCWLSVGERPARNDDFPYVPTGATR